MQNVKCTGIYQNVSKHRWEFWYVGSEQLKVLVSWLSWAASKEYEKWARNCLLNEEGLKGQDAV